VPRARAGAAAPLGACSTIAASRSTTHHPTDHAIAEGKLDADERRTTTSRQALPGLSSDANRHRPSHPVDAAPAADPARRPTPTRARHVRLVRALAGVAGIDPRPRFLPPSPRASG